MATINQPTGLVRTDITLEGGGRLEGVADIADIRLEVDNVRWERTAPDSVEVTGAIHAYIYTLQPRGNTIDGQGFRIPFNRQITDEKLTDVEPKVSVENLQSKHEFNPITGDFQHKVTAVLVLSDPSSPPAQSELKGNVQAKGETRLSQIAVGERKPPPDETSPSSSRPPTPEEFEAMKEQIEEDAPKEAKVGDQVSVPDESPDSNMQIADEEISETENIDEEKQGDKEDGGPLQWKAFPPPIS